MGRMSCMLKPVCMADGPGDDTQQDQESGIALKDELEVKPPKLYKVLLLNDDFTPMEFVIEILERLFDKDHAMATELMMKVHQEGKAVAGIYPYEIAETKVATVTEKARKAGFPLQSTMELED